jgi:hypothetical protein
MYRRLSFRFTISQIWKPYMRGSAASRTTARGNSRWIASMASTPSWTRCADNPQLRIASTEALPRAASGSATSTLHSRRTSSAAGGEVGTTGAATAGAVGVAVAGAVGTRTRKSAEHFVQRSFAPSGPTRAVSTRYRALHFGQAAIMISLRSLGRRAPSG